MINLEDGFKLCFLKFWPYHISNNAKKNLALESWNLSILSSSTLNISLSLLLWHHGSLQAAPPELKGKACSMFQWVSPFELII